MTQNKRSSLWFYATNRGAALIMSMVLMIMLSLLGVAAMNTSVQEQRIAMAFRDSVLGLAKAEAGAEMARAIVAGTNNPNLQGYNCTNAASTHYWPADRTEVMYCIDTIDARVDNTVQNNRGSGQRAQSRQRIFVYKIDSIYRQVLADGTIGPWGKWVQTVEQLTRTTD